MRWEEYCPIEDEIHGVVKMKILKMEGMASNIKHCLYAVGLGKSFGLIDMKDIGNLSKTYFMKKKHTLGLSEE